MKKLIQRLKNLYEELFVWHYWCYSITKESGKYGEHEICWFRTKWQHWVDKFFNRKQYLKKVVYNKDTIV